MVVTIMTVRVGELVGGMDSESVAGFLVPYVRRSGVLGVDF